MPNQRLTFEVRISPHEVRAILSSFTRHVLQDGIEFVRKASGAKDPPRFVIKGDGTRKGISSFLSVNDLYIDSILMKQ